MPIATALELGTNLLQSLSRAFRAVRVDSEMIPGIGHPKKQGSDAVHFERSDQAFGTRWHADDILGSLSQSGPRHLDSPKASLVRAFLGCPT